MTTDFLEYLMEDPQEIERLDAVDPELLEEVDMIPYEQTHVFTVRTGEIRVRQQPRVEGRHPHEDSGPRQQLHYLIRVEFRSRSFGFGNSEFAAEIPLCIGEWLRCRE